MENLIFVPSLPPLPLVHRPFPPNHDLVTFDYAFRAGTDVVLRVDGRKCQKIVFFKKMYTWYYYIDAHWCESSTFSSLSRLVSGVHGEDGHGDDTEYDKEEFVVALRARVVLRHALAIFIVEGKLVVGGGGAVCTVDVSGEFFEENFSQRHVHKGTRSNTLNHLSRQRIDSTDQNVG